MGRGLVILEHRMPVSWRSVPFDLCKFKANPVAQGSYISTDSRIRSVSKHSYIVGNTW